MKSPRRLGRSARLSSLGTHRRDRLIPVASNRAASCRVARHMPGLEERPFELARIHAMLSPRNKVRF